MNFNNIFSGMLSLFVLSTIEGWPNYMYHFVDADDFGPKKDANTWMIGYFLVFILLGSMFLLNLFIGVIFLNYHIAEKAAKNQYLSEN